ncbi:MAG: hypothetical protein JSV35_06850 [Candidatus Bathyarchaeota archaeon]|nr:MAG: hypothetical protein JSV35_06850 [Candidatus Bathyarchaeota archaeon]
MTCYFRHLTATFNEAGIEVTKENRRDIDKIIHGIMEVDYKNCSATWKKVKERLVDDKDGFISDLRQALR